MLTETQAKALKPDILQQLQKIYVGMDITDIDLHPDEGFDGDPILRVYISYKGEIPDKGGTRAAAINSIRDILQGKDDFSFPVMTLIPQKNVRKRGRVA
ncbi:hypothetical protein DPQ22_05980 [Candidatus Tokpelaia sp.]|nr:hypothetical protein DPQ22_05980 [Candidatus Tokpelaia sp.]